MSGTNLDITERKEMETSLSMALNRSEVLLQTTPTAIALVSKREIRRCNPAMERLFGAAPGTLYGRSTRTLFASDADWNAADEKARQAITKGDTFSEQLEFVRADGERFWAMVAARELEPGSAEMHLHRCDGATKSLASAGARQGIRRRRQPVEEQLPRHHES